MAWYTAGPVFPFWPGVNAAVPSVDVASTSVAEPQCLAAVHILACHVRFGASPKSLGALSRRGADREGSVHEL